MIISRVALSNDFSETTAFSSTIGTFCCPKSCEPSINRQIMVTGSFMGPQRTLPVLAVNGTAVECLVAMDKQVGRLWESAGIPCGWL